MTQDLVIALRWVLYFDLGLLFGLPLFGLYAWRGYPLPNAYTAKAIAGLAIIGLCASALAFASQAAAMAGVAIRSLDANIVKMLLDQTAFGAAFKVRELALLVVLFCAPMRARLPLLAIWIVMFAGGIALITLPWSGHGAAGEGVKGWMQLAADILHLLAASAWLGAIAGFLIMMFGGQWKTSSGLVLTSRALAGFSNIGTVLVGTLIATGLVNASILVGFASFFRNSLYASVLLAKLALFVCMLVLAGLNRYRLTPALEQAAGSDQIGFAAASLRKSLMREGVIALLIFGLVAWLTTLAPPR